MRRLEKSEVRGLDRYTSNHYKANGIRKVR